MSPSGAKALSASKGLFAALEALLHRKLLKRSFLFRIRQKPVAYAANGKQVARLGGIVFDVTPQPNHEIVDGAGVGVLVQVPNFLENLFARNHAAVIAHQVP